MKSNFSIAYAVAWQPEDQPWVSTALFTCKIKRNYTLFVDKSKFSNFALYVITVVIWCCQHLKFHIQVVCFCLFQGFTSEQMRLAEENSALIEQREKEIQSIVQSISELNEIFRDLATMIVEQVSFLCLTLMYKIYCHLLMFLAVTMLSEVCSSFWKVWIIKNVHKTIICQGSPRHNTLKFNSPSDNFAKILLRVTLPS